MEMTFGLFDTIDKMKIMTNTQPYYILTFQRKLYLDSEKD